MKNTLKLKNFAGIIAALLISTTAVAEEQTTEAGAYDSLKTEYNLTDEQVKSMTDRGLHGPELNKVARLAQKSGKTLDEVMKMRLDDKMGWGKIAKELGVHPSELGKSVSHGRHAMKEDKMERHSDKAAARAEKQADRAAKKAEKAEKHKENHGK